MWWDAAAAAADAALMAGAGDADVNKVDRRILITALAWLRTQLAPGAAKPKKTAVYAAINCAHDGSEPALPANAATSVLSGNTIWGRQPIPAAALAVWAAYFAM